MPTAAKAMKERDCTQKPVGKKERTDHKCLWQRKKEQATNAYGNEGKTKPQMMVANEKWLP